MKKYVKMYRTVLSIFSTESTFKRKGKKAQETLEQHIILKQRDVKDQVIIFNRKNQNIGQ